MQSLFRCWPIELPNFFHRFLQDLRTAPHRPLSVRLQPSSRQPYFSLYTLERTCGTCQGLVTFFHLIANSILHLVIPPIGLCGCTLNPLVVIPGILSASVFRTSLAFSRRLVHPARSSRLFSQIFSGGFVLSTSTTLSSY